MLPTLFANSFVSMALLLTPPSFTESKSTIRYRYFDEYLIHLDKGDQAFIIGEEIEGSGEIEIGKGGMGSILKKPLPIRSGVTHNKDVSCCMLGQLAGEKGYLCNAKFYVSRLISRNYNRPHNKRIEALQDDSPIRGSSEKLMQTFGQCVSRGIIFHKCCYIAAMEVDEPRGYDSTKRRMYEKFHGDKNRKTPAH